VAYETIIYEKENGVATITLNRPQALNAFVPQMNKEVLEALKDGERDRVVRCLVITGAGRAFCAGQDLKDRTPDQKGSLGASLREKYNPMIRQIRQMEKIVIAAVNGVAAGAGCNLALSCDLRVASEDAKFIQSFIRVGLAPDSGGSFILPRLVGLSKAMELLLLGEPNERDCGESRPFASRHWTHQTGGKPRQFVQPGLRSRVRSLFARDRRQKRGL
jgi:2-(1,2-epoxy-1,2-dihydrophenyl)acetyl-CoA isomerase